MPDSMYHPTTAEVSARRKALAPEIHEAFEQFSSAVFAEGALPEKTKQLIAVAVAHVTQCPFCITGHTKLARRKGASPEEIMEAIWVAAEMRAGGAFAHATLAIDAMDHSGGHRPQPPSGNESNTLIHEQLCHRRSSDDRCTSVPSTVTDQQMSFATTPLVSTRHSAICLVRRS